MDASDYPHVAVTDGAEDGLDGEAKVLEGCLQLLLHHLDRDMLLVHLPAGKVDLPLFVPVTHLVDDVEEHAHVLHLHDVHPQVERHAAHHPAHGRRTLLLQRLDVVQDLVPRRVVHGLRVLPNRLAAGHLVARVKGVDKLAEALAQRQRSGTGVADEEAGELGSMARPNSWQQLIDLVHFQFLRAAAPAVPAGGGLLVTPIVMQIIVLLHMRARAASDPLPAFDAVDVLHVVLIVAAEVVPLLQYRVLLARDAARGVDLVLIEYLDALRLLPALGLRGRTTMRDRRHARDA